MRKRDFRKYVAYVKERRQVPIADYYIEKDYFLSLFLSTWHSLQKTGKTPFLDKLIFKGGTLLVRNYLQYPRISEDLDFTHKDSNTIRRIENTNKREKEIKNRMLPILKEMNMVCNAGGFDFNNDRKNKRYIQVRNSRAVYVLRFYYLSMVTNEEIPIKFEINFLENIIHTCNESKIQTIIEMDTFLKSIGYDFEPININVYSLDEIILEKYRAILTRETVKERDILDLYLIHLSGTDVFNVDTDLIVTKIHSGLLIAPDLQKNFDKNCRLFQNQAGVRSDDDISRFTWIPIDISRYAIFKNILQKKILAICERA